MRDWTIGIGQIEEQDVEIFPFLFFLQSGFDAI